MSIEDFPLPAKLTLEWLEAVAESLVSSTVYKHIEGTQTVVCVLKLHNGAEFSDTTTCGVPSDFDFAALAKAARNLAMNKVYNIAYYLYRDQQYKAGAVLEVVSPPLPQPEPGAVRWLDATPEEAIVKKAEELAAHGLLTEKEAARLQAARVGALTLEEAARLQAAVAKEAEPFKRPDGQIAMSDARQMLGTVRTAPYEGALTAITEGEPDAKA